MTPDHPLWRAQLGCEEQESDYAVDEDGGTELLSIAYSAERMRPSVRFSGEGRVNCRGIPVLYLSTCAETAVSEVRPHCGAEVTVSCFRAHHPLRVVDCSQGYDADERRHVFQEAPTLDSIWHGLSKLMVTPLYDLTRTEQYATTQIVAEHIRRAGYDGLKFKSSLGCGENLALFDPDAAKAVSGDVVRVTRVQVEIERGDRWTRGWP